MKSIFCRFRRILNNLLESKVPLCFSLEGCQFAVWSEICEDMNRSTNILFKNKFFWIYNFWSFQISKLDRIKTCKRKGHSFVNRRYLWLFVFATFCVHHKWLPFFKIKVISKILKVYIFCIFRFWNFFLVFILKHCTNNQINQPRDMWVNIYNQKWLHLFFYKEGFVNQVYDGIYHG